MKVAYWTKFAQESMSASWMKKKRRPNTRKIESANSISDGRDSPFAPESILIFPLLSATVFLASARIDEESNFSFRNSPRMILRCPLVEPLRLRMSVFVSHRVRSHDRPHQTLGETPLLDGGNQYHVEADQNRKDQDVFDRGLATIGEARDGGAIGYTARFLLVSHHGRSPHFTIGLSNQTQHAAMAIEIPKGIFRVVSAFRNSVARFLFETVRRKR